MIEKLHILFVCSTNTTLSPLAVVIANDLSEAKPKNIKFTFDSAGTHPGKTPREVERRASKYAADRGFDLSLYRSKQLTENLLENADYIFCMTEDHFWFVKKLLGKHLQKKEIYLMTHFTKQYGVREIADPLFGEICYEDAVLWLRKSLEGFFEYLKRG